MPVLKNPRHERFAQELAKGKSATEAYGLAGYKPNQQNASRLMLNDVVKARVAELSAKVAERAIERAALTKEWVIEKLRANLERAERSDQGSVANRTLELLGKEVGMFIERREVGAPGEFADISDEKLNDEIARLSGHVPDGPAAAAGAAEGTRAKAKQGRLH